MSLFLKTALHTIIYNGYNNSEEITTDFFAVLVGNCIVVNVSNFDLIIVLWIMLC